LKPLELSALHFLNTITLGIFNLSLQIEGDHNVAVWFTEWHGVENGRISFIGLEFGHIHGEHDYLLEEHLKVVTRNVTIVTVNHS